MTRYDIDQEETKVWIDARSSLHPIHSETSALGGFLEAELSSGRVDLHAGVKASFELPLDRVTSGTAMYDREMLRRVDARRYPTISAELSAMTAGEKDGTYLAEGDVTFRGVTCRVSDEVTITSPKPGTIVFEGEHVFNLPEFGMDPPKILMFKVYPDVKVKVRIVAMEKS